MKLSEIHTNPNNPRLIKDDRFKKLVKSIEEFPKMMELRPIIVDSDGLILGGNMRFKALQELKYKDVPENWIKRADELTEEEKQRFIIADNIESGEWEWELLKEWNKEKLQEWGLDMIEFASEKQDLSETLNEYFKIEIVCKDEKEQELTYNKLIEEGYECRLLTF